nr:helix-hairpin-helix domain-containing protein [Victivallales bacterium]
DGIYASLTNGVLATRGDGYDGEDISDKLPLIELEKNGYKGPPVSDARGEIVIRNDDFKNIYSKILRKDGKSYKNQRNAVAGIVGLKDIADMVFQKAKLTLVDYDTHAKSVKFSELKDEKIWDSIVKEFSSLPYPMDGIVIKLNDKTYSENLGTTAHHPRGQIAFKFSGLRAHSVIRNVEWSFGKNCITPIAAIDPVEIGGITIKNVTLHNFNFVKANDLHIGDKIIVERAGDVIPHMLSSEPSAERKSFLIEKCPSCDTTLVIDGPEIKCPNEKCPEVSLQRLLAAVRSIGIERLGEPTLRKMVSSLGVKNLKDILSLSKEQISSMEGFKSKSSENLFQEINAAKNTTDFALIASLNIQGIGKNIAKSILEKFSLSELRKMSAHELEQIPNIGPERAKELYEKLSMESNTIDELIQALNISESKGSDTKKRPTICFTGKMPLPRSHYQQIAEENGYDLADSVTEDLDLLVVASMEEKSSKLQKAEKYGIKILLLDQWTKLLTGQKVKEPEPNNAMLPGF